MAEVKKYKVLEDNRVTLAGENLRKDAIIELPEAAGKQLIKEKLVKAAEVEVKKPAETEENKKVEEELQAEYEKNFKALDKKNRGPLYEVAKEIIEIRYDIKKDDLIEAIIEANKIKAVLTKLEAE